MTRWIIPPIVIPAAIILTVAVFALMRAFGGIAP